ncbi:MAG: hypothetical protein HRT69_18085 [Flavobacteriaceae bacterium]|nr:hypothetical protein [Flavobacteriaceae bacterium]
MFKIRSSFNGFENKLISFSKTKVLADKRTQMHLDGRTPKKVIIVPGKIINLVG